MLHCTNYYWFLVSTCLLSYGWTCMEGRWAWEKCKSNKEIAGCDSSSQMFHNFLSASITWRTHANHETILISLFHWHTFYLFQTHWKLTDVQFDSLIIIIASSVCIHKIMEHTNDISKLIGWNNVTWLAML